MHDCVLIIEKLKEFSHQQCEEKKMEISSKDKEANKLQQLKSKSVLAKLEVVEMFIQFFRIHF